MNKEWSDLNKEFQHNISSKKNFLLGISNLLKLRRDLYQEIFRFANLPDEYYYEMPFINSKGFENKTIAYSLYHIFRIEDIVLNILIKKQEDIFTSQGFQSKLNCKIRTTGNELVREEIKDFSKELDYYALFNYLETVYKASNDFLSSLKYEDSKKQFDKTDKERIIEEEVVSSDEKANFLVSYWCGKDIAGLLKMPFSRHWIMHIEAMNRILNKLL